MIFFSRYVAGRESSLEAVISVPRLQTQARAEALLQKSFKGVMLKIDSSATAYGSSISQKIVFIHGMIISQNAGSSLASKNNSMP